MSERAIPCAIFETDRGECLSFFKVDFSRSQFSLLECEYA